MTELDLDALRTQLRIPDQGIIELPRVPSVPRAFALAMPEERSFDLWEAATNAVRSSGYTAVGIGSREAVLQLADHMAGSDWFDLEAETELARTLDIGTWLSTREQELLEEAGPFPEGEWLPDEEPFGGFWFPFDREGAHLNPWWLGIVPAASETDVPLSLAYGGWNECPHPRVHSALSRRWNRAHEAKLVAVGPDTMEFMVDSPPKTKEDALALAKEHYLYCRDNIDQGTRTIGRYASKLIGAHVWSFWWD